MFPCGDSKMSSDCERFHRRDVLTLGTTAGLMGLSLPDILRSQARASRVPQERTARADSIIMLWLAGGPATIDMWDLKPDAPEEIRGEFKAAETSVPGIRLSEHLSKVGQTAKHLAVVRSMHHTVPAHGPATVFMTTGNKPTPAIEYPSLGSLTSKLLKVPEGVPPYVSFNDIRGQGGAAGYLGAGYNPFIVEGAGGGKNAPATLRVRGIQLPGGFSLGQLNKRDALLRDFDDTFRKVDEKAELVSGYDAFHQKALDILRSDRTKKAFDLAAESQATRERYGTDSFGTGALAARRLVEAGVRCVTLSLGGWDTHRGNFDSLKTRLLPTLDRLLSALVGDLAERGMLDRTIVYCAGEFGRTPKINKTVGRDHWARSMSVVVAGGGFKRGIAFGSTDPQGMAPASNPVTPDDLASTVFHNLGIDPKMELQSGTGRPMTLFREGSVIEKLLA